jgi:ABC-type phosphonate transport system ATPase subunit
MIAVQDDEVIDVWENAEPEANRIARTTWRILDDRDGVRSMWKPAGQIAGLGTDYQD